MEPTQKWFDDAVQYKEYLEGILILRWQIRFLDRLGIVQSVIDKLTKAYWDLKRLSNDSPWKDTLDTVITKRVNATFSREPCPPDTITRDERWNQSLRHRIDLVQRIDVIMACFTAAELRIKNAVTFEPAFANALFELNAGLNVMTEWLKQYRIYPRVEIP